MKQLKKIFSLIFILSFAFAEAQQLPLDNQYLINNFALNPAYAGANGNVESFVLFRQNWTGLAGAPQTKMFNINGNMNKNMGLGGNIVSDEIGIFNRLAANCSYSYALKFSNDHFLRFGVSAGVLESHIDLSGIKSESAADPLVAGNQNIRSVKFDANLGVAWSFRGWQAGFVLPQLTQGKISQNKSVLYSLQRHYIFHLSYAYDIGKDWQVQPFAILRKTANSNLFYEFSGLVKYKRAVWLGTTFRKGSTYAMTIGGVLYGKVAFSYSYEFGQGMLAGSANNELSMGFVLGKNTPSHTSVFSNEPVSKKKPYMKWLSL